MEERTIKSPCLKGDISIIHLIQVVVFVIGIIAAVSIFWASNKDLPQQVKENTKSISEMKPRVETIYDDVKIIKKHILQKK